MVFKRIKEINPPWVHQILNENNLSTEGLFNEDVVLYAIFQDVIPVALGALEIEGESVMLRSVCTKGDVKKKGLGKLVVQHILAEAKKQNLKSVYLLTDTAEKFFLKLGFNKTERKNLPTTFETKPLVKNVCTQNSVCMELHLEKWEMEFKDVSVVD